MTRFKYTTLFLGIFICTLTAGCREIFEEIKGKFQKAEEVVVVHKPVIVNDHLKVLSPEPPEPKIGPGDPQMGPPPLRLGPKPLNF